MCFKQRKVKGQGSQKFKSILCVGELFVTITKEEVISPTLNFQKENLLAYNKEGLK